MAVSEVCLTEVGLNKANSYVHLRYVLALNQLVIVPRVVFLQDTFRATEAMFRKAKERCRFEPRLRRLPLSGHMLCRVLLELVGTLLNGRMFDNRGGFLTGADIGIPIEKHE